MNDVVPLLPALCGMPRSSSRMTWQILKLLSPAQRPEWWYPDLQGIEAQDWPVRRHTYFPDIPVIYTYRHPVEAYLSWLSRISQDVGKMVPADRESSSGEISDIDPLTGTQHYSGEMLMTPQRAAKAAMVRIGDHWDIHKKIVADKEAGREVLFLKYEDYFGNEEKRIHDIASFMNVEVTDTHLRKILEFSNIEINMKRGQAIVDFVPASTFSKGVNNETGMQRGHVNLKTMGRPGAHIKMNPDFMQQVIKGVQPAHQALKEMCEYFGYECIITPRHGVN